MHTTFLPAKNTCSLTKLKLRFQVQNNLELDAHAEGSALVHSEAARHLQMTMNCSNQEQVILLQSVDFPVMNQLTL
jgi:hypothetical protein